MTSKEVLGKIAKMLNLSSEEVMFTDAKTADGTILQSPTFDLGETVEVVSEDGTKTPAPDGEHEIALKDSEGNEVVIRIETKDGVITQRENVEEAKPEVGEETEMVKEDKVDSVKKAETVETEPLPGDGEIEMAGVAEAGGPLGAGAETETVSPIPQTEDKPELSLETVFAKVEEMAYRISELEKVLETKMAEVEVEINPEEETEDEELPKLDGAPVEQMFSQTEIQNRYGKKDVNPQATFLSKLYNK